jgi:hypothetical protein
MEWRADDQPSRVRPGRRLLCALPGACVSASLPGLTERHSPCSCLSHCCRQWYLPRRLMRRVQLSLSRPSQHAVRLQLSCASPPRVLPCVRSASGARCPSCQSRCHRACAMRPRAQAATRTASRSHRRNPPPPPPPPPRCRVPQEWSALACALCCGWRAARDFMRWRSATPMSPQTGRSGACTRVRGDRELPHLWGVCAIAWCARWSASHPALSGSGIEPRRL